MSIVKESFLEEKVKDHAQLYQEMTEMIREMEALLRTLCHSDASVMTRDLERMVMAGGKRLRPSLAWVCWKLGKEEKLEILPLMCMLELMHTTSLIHDDVVDDAPLRRGACTIHETSGRKAAVQSGDFLLARAMEYLHIYRGTGINEALAEISTQMCLGEFQQMQSLYDVPASTQESYFQQIKRKTAYLIAVSCYTGALAGGLSMQEALALRSFGEQIGIAFQIKDDILDITGTDILGKEKGQDIRRGIFTLPLLYAFENQPSTTMERLAAKKEKNQRDVEELLEYIVSSKGLEYAEFQIRICSQRAVKALEVIREGKEKDALIQMAQTLRKRKL